MVGPQSVEVIKKQSHVLILAPLYVCICFVSYYDKLLWRRLPFALTVSGKTGS